MASTIIIGAGLSGLIAARELARSGHGPVTVVESADRPGGLAITLEHDGCRMDLGPHRINTELAEAQSVFDETSPDQRIETIRRSHMRLAGAFYRYPPSMMEFGLRMPVRALAFGASLLNARLRGVAPENEMEPSCESLLKTLYGPALYDFFFGPYMAKVWKTAPSRLDRRIVRARIESGKGGLLRAIRPRSIKKLHYLKGGIEALPRRLAGEVVRAGGRIITGASVVALEKGPSGVGAVICVAADGPLRFEADLVLSTIPLPDLVRLCQPLLPVDAALTRAARLRFLKMLLVNLIYDLPRVSRDSWMYFPESRATINRLHEPKNFDPSMAPADRSLISAEITSLESCPLWEKSDDALLHDLADFMDQERVAPLQKRIGGFVYRLACAYPLYDLGFRAHFDETLEYVGQFPNLVTFGRQGLFCHNNMDHSIVMGLRAAEAARAENPSRAMRDRQPEFDRFRIID